MPRDLVRLALLLLGAVLARLGCPGPSYYALHGVSEAGALVAAIAPVWLAVAWRARARVAMHAAAATLLFLGAQLTIEGLPGASHYGVEGHAAALLFSLVAIAWVGGDGAFARFGLRLDLRVRRQRRALLAVSGVLGGLFVVCLALAHAHVITREMTGPPVASLRETLVFQFFVVAVDEELAFRGFLQTYLDDLLPARMRLLGAGFLGLGALVSGLLFALFHMLKVRFAPVTVSFEFQPFMLHVFIYVWLRAYTGSVWPCVALHGLWDGLGNSVVHYVVAQAG